MLITPTQEAALVSGLLLTHSRCHRVPAFPSFRMRKIMPCPRMLIVELERWIVFTNCSGRIAHLHEDPDPLASSGVTIRGVYLER